MRRTSRGYDVALPARAHVKKFVQTHHGLQISLHDFDSRVLEHTMRSALFLGRLCLRHGTRCIRTSIPRQQRHSSISSRVSQFRSQWRRPPVSGTLILAALSPAAFVKLSEEDKGDGKTREDHMLEASRAEIEKSLPDDLQGVKRAWRGIYLLWDRYVFEPIATGFRFLHLVIIFVPVIFMVPVIWIGRRQKDRDNERSGTLWWYGFLVRSMERAGPAFIKVCIPRILGQDDN